MHARSPQKLNAEWCLSFEIDCSQLQLCTVKSLFDLEMSHRVGRKSQISNREYEFDNYCFDTTGCLDRCPDDAHGLQSVSYHQVKNELAWLN